MTRPRSALVSASDTPYYHCIGRCVRRAFLCGQDPVSGKSFDHRKQLILERLSLLTEVFAIDLCAYALMSNHYHLVVHLAVARAATWTAREVVERWRQLYTGPPCAQRFLDGGALDEVEHALLHECIGRWRARLCDLSWFMRCLNEHIARMANAEDQCTGRFWEGRFKSQALLDETALLMVMAYVDLNPVRAGLAESIETATFTSGQQRLAAVMENETTCLQRRAPRLLPFVESMRHNPTEGLPFNIQDYLDLLDTTGRQVHPMKRGVILATTPTLLLSLGVSSGEWLKNITTLHTRYRLFIGAPHRLSTLARKHGWRWIHGQSAARRLYCRVNA